MAPPVIGELSGEFELLSFDSELSEYSGEDEGGGDGDSERGGSCGC